MIVMLSLKFNIFVYNKVGYILRFLLIEKTNLIGKLILIYGLYILYSLILHAKLKIRVHVDLKLKSHILMHYQIFQIPNIINKHNFFNSIILIFLPCFKLDLN